MNILIQKYKNIQNIFYSCEDMLNRLGFFSPFLLFTRHMFLNDLSPLFSYLIEVLNYFPGFGKSVGHLLSREQ